MKQKLLMIIFVLVLGSILTTALVGVNRFTAPQIEKNAEVKQKSSVLEALDIPYEPGTVEQTFANNVKAATKNGITYYIAADGEYAIPYTGPGLWGQISGIIAMNPNLVKIMGLTIVQQEETPGLGSRIAEKNYLDAFKGKQFSPNLVLVTPGTAKGDNQIDAISGATLSSKAFIKILNTEQQRFESALGGK